MIIAAAILVLVAIACVALIWRWRSIHAYRRDRFRCVYCGKRVRAGKHKGYVWVSLERVAHLDCYGYASKEWW